MWVNHFTEIDKVEGTDALHFYLNLYEELSVLREVGKMRGT